MFDRKTEISQVSESAKVNLTAGSNRVKAPVVGAGRKDSGCDQTHADSSKGLACLPPNTTIEEEDYFKKRNTVIRSPEYTLHKEQGNILRQENLKPIVEAQ